MPNPFMEDFFVDSNAKTLYERTLAMLTRGTWVPTPLTDPGMADERLYDWWWKAYEALQSSLGMGGALADGEVDRAELSAALDEFRERDARGATRRERAFAIINALGNLERKLERYMPKDLAQKPGLAAAEENFRNACYSIAKGVVAVMENASRGPRDESFNHTVAELLGRDTAGQLHALIEDPPRELFMKEKYRKDQSGDEYLSWASRDIELWKIDARDANLERELGDRIREFNQAEKELKAEPGNANFEARRNSALIGLALNLQYLTTKTRELAATKADGAGPAAEFSMVAVEAMRQVFGLYARGFGEDRAPLAKEAIDKRKEAATRAVGRIREREGKKEEVRGVHEHGR